MRIPFTFGLYNGPRSRIDLDGQDMLLAEATIAGHRPDGATLLRAPANVAGNAMSHYPAFHDQFVAIEQFPDRPRPATPSLGFFVFQALDPHAVPSDAAGAAGGPGRWLPLRSNLKQPNDRLAFLRQGRLQLVEMLLEAEIFDNGADVSDDQFRMVDEELDHLCPVRFMVEVAGKASGVHGSHQCRFAAEAKDLSPAECLLDRVMVGSVHEVMGHPLGQPHRNTYITESKAKVLRPFSAEDQRAIAREAGKTPLKIWKEIATDHAMAIAGERYSPHWLAKAARRVMEKIDTDPASCGAANKTIGAKRYFDQDKDGLTRKWHGATYLNPPFGPGWKDWIVKLAEEIEAGRVTEAVVVGPHTMLVSIDSPWFRILLEGSIFLPEQRPRFSEGCGGKETGVKYGTFVAYVGKRHRRFARVLGNQGIILRAVSTRPAKRRVVS